MHHLILGGGYLLNTETLKLTKHGQTISLQSKYKKVLLYLFENKSRIVSQNELIEAFWGSNYELGSKGVLRAMSSIRKALNDDASDPKYIITHRQKGYQFIVQSEQLSDNHEIKATSTFTLP